MRLFAGVAVRPLVVGVLASMSVSLLLHRRGRNLGGGLTPDLRHAALTVALGGSVVAVFVTLVGALPMAVRLMKRRHVSLTETILFGLGFGNRPFVLGTILAGSDGLEGFMRDAAFSFVLGHGGRSCVLDGAIRTRSPHKG